jgi:hypothetical protein
MNEKIKELALQAGGSHYPNVNSMQLEKFAELMTAEFIGILEHEIKLVEGYKEQAFNDRDREWHEGKIVHFYKLIDKTKKHFGVDNVGT